MNTRQLQERLANMRISAVEAEQTCQFCDRHSAKECWNWQKKQNNNPRATERECFSFDQLGHSVRECRYRRNLGRATRGAYHTCGNDGHWFKKCPQNVPSLDREWQRDVENKLPKKDELDATARPWRAEITHQRDHYSRG